MKVLVTKMPTNPQECIFNRMYPDTRSNGCILADSRDKCLVGSEGFKCPYLQQFKAVSKEQVYPDRNTYKITPVDLIKED